MKIKNIMMIVLSIHGLYGNSLNDGIKACNQGSADGCHEVANIYLQGLFSTIVDYNKSFKYIEKSCQLGSDKGCLGVINYYLEGVGVKQDKLKAEELLNDLKKSCEKSNAKDCKNVGIFYNFRPLKKMEAVKWFEKSLKIEPKNDVLLNWIGSIYYDKREFAQAKKWYEKTVEVNATREEAWYNLGSIAYVNKNLDKAIEYYQSTIKINKNYSNAYLWLGNSYFQKKEYKQSIKYHKEYLHLNRDYADRVNDLINQAQEALKKIEK